MLLAEDLEVGDILTHDTHPHFELIVKIDIYYDSFSDTEKCRIYSDALNANLDRVYPQLEMDVFAECYRKARFTGWKKIILPDWDLGI